MDSLTPLNPCINPKSNSIRDYGSPNEDISNIFINIMNDKEVNSIIDRYTFERKWVYHPIRQFEKWQTISKIYYNNESYFWIPIVFNKIIDPFHGLTDFNIVRIPELQFLFDLPYLVRFSFLAADF